MALTPEQVLEILQSETSARVLGPSMGCSRQTIEQVRQGRLYRNLHPEVPRWQAKRSCKDCGHFSPRFACTLELPESRDYRAAQTCPYFI